MLRVARRLSRTQEVDGVHRLNEGASRDDFFGFWQELGVGDWLGEGQDTAVQRERVPVVPVCPALSPADPVWD
jgi:hypothetical protein